MPILEVKDFQLWLQNSKTFSKNNNKPMFERAAMTFSKILNGYLFLKKSL